MPPWNGGSRRLSTTGAKMEAQHSSHTHPAPNGQQESAHPPCSDTSPSFSAASALEGQPVDNLNPQSRRLHIRTARFSAPFLPGRRVSPLFELSRRSSRDNSPLPIDRPRVNPESDPVSPTSILQEIHNLASRTRRTSRPSLVDIFEDEGAMVSPDGIKIQFDHGKVWIREMPVTQYRP